VVFEVKTGAETVGVIGVQGPTVVVVEILGMVARWIVVMMYARGERLHHGFEAGTSKLLGVHHSAEEKMA
jgi:hypothetical protein